MQITIISLIRATCLTILSGGALALPSPSPDLIRDLVARSPPRPTCYPALDFIRPTHMPQDNSHWWCDPSTEYAFLGFSYEVTACQSQATLRSEFLDIRNTFRSRYIRLYGVCDRQGFYDDVIAAAWDAHLGVHALIWFGFDGTDQWKGRRDALFNTLRNNPLAPYVTRVVQFGSEPLFDQVLPIGTLTSEVTKAKSTLSSLGIPVTISEMAYGFQSTANSQQLLNAVDSINIHTLPFFAFDASTANNSWPLVSRDLDYFVEHGGGKKMIMAQNGWPSVTSDGVQNNSIYAVADIPNERDYSRLLDAKCSYFKSAPGGGIGWFWHIYSDNQEPGYGLYNKNMQLKFPFSPQTQC